MYSMPVWKASISIFLLLICSVLMAGPSPAQDIGVRGGSSNPPPEPKRAPVTRRAPSRQPARRAPETRAKRRATLTVLTDPTECEVYLNDAYRGTTSSRNGKLVIPDLETATKLTIRVYKRDVGEELKIFELD